MSNEGAQPINREEIRTTSQKRARRSSVNEILDDLNKNSQMMREQREFSRENYMALIRRQRRASLLEIGLVSFFVPISVLLNAQDYSAFGPESNFDLIYMTIIRATYQPTMFIPIVSLFFEIFVYILTGYSIVVNIVKKILPRSKEELNYAQANSERIYLDTSREKIVHRASEFIPEVSEVEKADYIGQKFSKFLERSRISFDVAQRRPNALLFVGTTIAAVGLVFFLLTLPGFLVLPVGNQEPVSIEEISRRLMDLTPRLLMLVFIQLLAGFFLRQYRSSMEEVRYYESILRFRESQFLSYLIRRKADDGSLKEFAQSLLENKDFIKLQQGETTLILEAQKGETNEFKGVFETFADLLRPRDSTSAPKDAKNTQ